MSLEDKAQEDEAFHWSMRNSGRLAPQEFKPGDPGYGPELCANEDCEETLPELRRRNGCTLCTECQATAERRARR